MSERPGSADGLGRSSEGTPDFAQPPPRVAPAPPPPPTPPLRPAGDVPTSRRPAVVTAVVVLVVAAVTALGTLAAWRADTRAVPAPASTSRPAPSPADPDRDTILFTGAHGTGKLAVREHTWESGSPDRLRLSVELSCTTGTVDHGPDSFQLFDATGTLVEPSPVSGGPGSIGYGTLGPGELVRGDVVFEVSRQVVTLVLSDDAGSVTALRITD
ncbi:hypothetical protein SAMN04488543_2958 [Friedmanniella luteola]|uniref:Uncharacterized protein n=1 Tax=Friedmanniella luteola TaxID=546871 RepID=A0A1H1XBW6_9ACTN|nr:hypothetical protein [Friedmanniella luteola]SDT06620.1 hypothetical protein SAMN04488543_2958 [Friedmanniella luteola]